MGAVRFAIWMIGGAVAVTAAYVLFSVSGSTATEYEHPTTELMFGCAFAGGVAGLIIELARRNS